MATNNSMKNEQQSHKKRTKNHGKSMNPTTYNPCPTLTDDIVDHIISFLPIKEAIQTSILSKRFEKSWKSSKHLHFDSNLPTKYEKIEVLSIIQQTLLLHSAPKIETFQLCVNPQNFEPIIVAWLNRILAKEPHSVDLDFFRGIGHSPPFKIPFELLDIECIYTLKFSYCNLLHLPPKFVGLHLLRTLILRHIKLNPEIINTFVDNCSLLECIDIAECHNMRFMKIVASGLKHFKVLKIGGCFELDFVYVDAPTLEVFHFVGKPYNVVFKGRMQDVSDVMLKFVPVSYDFPRHKMKYLMLNLWHVRVLTLTSTLLENIFTTLMDGRTKQRSVDYFWHLKELQLLMDASSFCNPYDIVKFLDKCPLIERLFIDFQSFAFDGTSQYWNMHDSAKFDAYAKEFPFMKLVKFSNFKFDLLELKLIKFLLGKSTNLENLAIFTIKKYWIQKKSIIPTLFLERLISWRSSLTTKVGIYKYNHEDATMAPKHKHLIWYHCY